MSFGKTKDETGSNGALPRVEGSAITGKLEAFLGQGSKVVGTLTFTGPVELDGYIEGELNAQDKLTIGESAVVNARIKGGEILVKGTVNGDIVATKQLSLRKPARVVGNITSASLSIEDGVVFEGTCSMSDSRPKSAASGSTSSKSGAQA